MAEVVDTQPWMQKLLMTQDTYLSNWPACHAHGSCYCLSTLVSTAVSGESHQVLLQEDHCHQHALERYHSLWIDAEDVLTGL